MFRNRTMKRLLFGLVAIGLPARISCIPEHLSRALYRRQNTTGSEQFHHRSFHNSIIAGNYLYIDGGDVTTWIGTGDGVQTENPQSRGNIYTQRANSTYSIDLSQSWTNSTVTLTTIPKTAPLLNNHALWLDNSNEKIYAYDGGLSGATENWYLEHPPVNSLWEITPSDGTGNWRQTYVSPSSNFTTLVRTTIGLYASGNDLGFALGGIQSDATGYNLFTDSIFDNNFVPGMVIYNMSSQEWYNVSSAEYTFSGLAMGGAAQFVPSFGPDGLLFVLGGSTGSQDNPQYVPFDKIFMYDPVSQGWSNQSVTGDMPDTTQNQCVVGAQGDEGTYEIYMYGGRYNNEVERTVQNGVVYVLSLPSFNWQKQTAPAEIGRYMHSCNMIGRQMISVGGIALYSDTDQQIFNIAGGIPDPWDQGFGVFDLTDLEWKSSYDADAGPYVTPNAVKEYIQQNGRFPSNWENAVVEHWFTNPGSKQALTAPSDSSDSSNDNSSVGNGLSSNTGAIAGGVVGGVVGLALIAGLIWLFLRRRRTGGQEQYQQQIDPKYAPMVEADANSHARFEADSQPRNELPGQYKASHGQFEADSRPMNELPGQDRTSHGQLHELDGRYSR